MSKSKKYEYQITQDASGWTASIIRHVTSKQTHISKTQSGFASQEEAKVWAEAQLKTFLKVLTERNKRRAEK